MRLTSLLLLSSVAACQGYDGFAQRAIYNKCEENARCSPSGLAGDCERFEVPGADDCDFDARAARRCLRDEWVCNTDQPGFEFAEPPTACDVVCVAP